MVYSIVSSCLSQGGVFEHLWVCREVRGCFAGGGQKKEFSGQTNLLMAFTLFLHIGVNTVLTTERTPSLQTGRTHLSRSGVRGPRWERRRGGSQSNVRIWVKNYQYPGRHLPNICFPIRLGEPGCLKPAAFRIHVKEYFLFRNIQRHQDFRLF